MDIASGTDSSMPNAFLAAALSIGFDPSGVNPGVPVRIAVRRGNRWFFVMPRKYSIVLMMASDTVLPKQKLKCAWLNITTGGPLAAANATTGTGSFGCVCNTTRSNCFDISLSIAARTIIGSEIGRLIICPPAFATISSKNFGHGSV